LVFHLGNGRIEPKNLNSSHRDHREHRERNGVSLFCWVPKKVSRNFVITVCFSSVISVANKGF
jgi:hypothetical protein